MGMTKPAIDIDGVAARLGAAIAIPTVSSPDSPAELARFDDFHRFLIESYPLAHKALTREVIAGHALLYRWPGQGSALPFGLLAHMDVVPVEQGTEGDWEYPAFSGHDDGVSVWGRGTVDDKCQLIALMETVESLLAAGFQPSRDIYLCFGHNEEIQTGEGSGARAIAVHLKKQGIHLAFVLDEGGAVLANPPFGLKKPAAMIGVAEKGYADVKLTVRGAGGHAAEPPTRTALGNLGRLLAAVEDHPQQVKLIPTVKAMLKALSRQIGGAQGFLLSHINLVKPLLLSVLMANSQVAAMLHTTVAATQAQGSPQANVLPQAASAVLNCRLLPGDTDEMLLTSLRDRAAKLKLDAEIELIRYSPAPQETSTSSEIFGAISTLATKIFGSVTIPYLVIGATDSREYSIVADEIYRMYPFLLEDAELGGMHGTNERIKKSSLVLAVRFMQEFIIQQAER
jgi:carboxypeptidase PM20D1